MWHCDELLTIVVIALVNRFVHSHVPTPVDPVAKVVFTTVIINKYAIQTFLTKKSNLSSGNLLYVLQSILWNIWKIMKA